MCGGATTFTSCVDTDEPAGIEELRGAKAELLRAKAQVELAEAAYKNAQAAIKQAKALYEQEVANQAAIRTEILAAQAEHDKAYWQQEAAKALETFNKEMYQLQQNTLQAQLAYEQALAQVEAALITAKDDIYAGELYKLLNTKTYTYNSVEFEVNESTGAITATPGTGTVSGLSGIAAALTEAKNNLAELMQKQALFEFTYDAEDLKVAAQTEKAQLEGEVAGLEKQLARLKDIQGTDINDFKAKYAELQNQLNDINDQIAALEMAKAEDADYAKALKDEAQLNEDKAIRTAYTMDVAADIQNTFYNVVNGITASGDVANLLTDIKNLAVQDAETGLWSFPNGIRVTTTVEQKADLLAALLDKVESDGRVLEGADLVTAQNEANAAKLDYETLQAELTEAETAWQAAYTAYKAAYDAGNYASADNNARTLIINAYNALPAQGAEGFEAARTAFIEAYKLYYAERTKLDGLKLPDGADIAVSGAAAWGAFVALADDNARFGFSSFLDIQDGAVGDLKKAAAAIGYEWDKVVALISYEDWKANNAIAGLQANGLAAKTFAAQKKSEDAAKKIAETTSWTAMAAAWTAEAEALQATIDEFTAREIAIKNAKADVDLKYAAQTSELNVQKAGIQDVMNVMENVVETESGQTGYAAAIAQIEWIIGGIEGAYDSANNTYTAGSIRVAQAKIAMCDELIAGIEAGDFEDPKQNILSAYATAIEAQTTNIDALTKLFETVSAQKDQLLALMTGEGGGTAAE